jgi:hypothetical protein
MGATLFTTPGLKGGISMSAVGIVLFVALIALSALTLGRRGGPRRGPSDPNPGDGWGGGPRPPDPRRPDPPRGGIPLDDAAPARVRLRGKGRLSDALPGRARRPGREPERTPVRHGEVNTSPADARDRSGLLIGKRENPAVRNAHVQNRHAPLETVAAPGEHGQACCGDRSVDRRAGGDR